MDRKDEPRYERLAGSSNFESWWNGIKADLILKDLWWISGEDGDLFEAPPDFSTTVIEGIKVLREKPLTVAEQKIQREWMVKNAKACAIIDLACTAPVAPLIADISSAKGKLEALKAAYRPSGDAIVVFYRKDLENTKMSEEQRVEDHYTTMRSKWTRLLRAGGKMTESDMIEIFLASLPPSWAPSIMTLSPLMSANPGCRSLEWLYSQLLAEDTRREQQGRVVETQVLMAQQRRAPNNFRRGSGGRRPPPRDISTVTCYRCQGKGHYSKDCTGELRPRPDRQGSNDRSQSLQQQHARYAHAESDPEEEVRLDRQFAGAAFGSHDRYPSFTEEVIRSPPPTGFPKHHAKIMVVTGTLGQQSASTETKTGEHAFLSTAGQCNDIAIDSGASSHMIQQRGWFRTYNLANIPIHLGDNRVIQAVGYGDVPLLCKVDGGVRVVVFQNCLHVPNIALNLISVPTLTKAGIDVAIRSKTMMVEITRNEKLIGTGSLKGGLFLLNVHSRITQMALKANTALPITEWHARLGHVGLDSIRRASKEQLAVDFEVTDSKDEFLCDHCVAGKLPRSPFNHAVKRAVAPLERIHSDVCGPMETQSIQTGKSYFVTFIDDYTRYTHIYFLRYKSEVLGCFQSFVEMAKARHPNHKIKELNTDNGGEYIGDAFKQYCEGRGIQIRTSAPHTSQMNGVAERMNRTILDGVRTSIDAAKLTKGWWGHAAQYIVDTRNRLPTSAVQLATPHELWFGEKPSYKHMRPFGSQLYFHVPKALRQKLDMKAKKGVMVGYSNDFRSYYIWSLEDKKVVKVRNYDCVFATSRPKDIDPQSRVDDAATDNSDPQGSENEKTDSAAPPADERTTATETSGSDTTGITPSSSGDLSADSGNSTQRPVRTKKLPNRLQDFVRSGLAKIEPEAWDIHQWCSIAAEHITSDEPPNPEEKGWRLAMDEEIAAMKKCQVYELVKRPKGNVVSCRFVLREKEDGRKKARLVARGFSQVEGLDYKETYAPTLRMPTIRAVLSHVAAHDWFMTQMDVKTAFLNGDLEEEIYMEQPEGYEERGDGYVWRMRKSLYGLKQSPKCWHDKVVKTLSEVGLVPTEADPSLFTGEHQGFAILLMLYVDDCIIASANEDSARTVRQFLESKFEMTHLGEPATFLGLEISRDRSRKILNVTQTRYLTRILERFDMKESAKKVTPMVNSPDLIKDYVIGGKPFDKTIYLCAIGSVMYAMIGTRPDVAHAVGVLARFSSSPQQSHWTAVKRLLRYLAGTIHYGMHYGPTPSPVLGYSDADYNADPEQRHSVTGWIFVANGGPISWRSKKQTSVSMSTTESEYMALSSAAREAIWLSKLFGSLTPAEEAPVIEIMEDNKSTISLARNPIISDRSKHIDTHYHFVREKIKEKRLAVTYIHTNDNIADAFTKELPTSTFDRHIENMKLDTSA